MGVYGVIREFFIINDDVVMFCCYCFGGFYVVEGVYNGLYELFEVIEVNFIGWDDKGEVYVFYVLIYCFIIGEVVGDGNFVFFIIFLVNFFQGILVVINNDI